MVAYWNHELELNKKKKEKKLHYEIIILLNQQVTNHILLIILLVLDYFNTVIVWMWIDPIYKRKFLNIADLIITLIMNIA